MTNVRYKWKESEKEEKKKKHKNKTKSSILFKRVLLLILFQIECTGCFHSISTDLSDFCSFKVTFDLSYTNVKSLDDFFSIC